MNPASVISLRKYFWFHSTLSRSSVLLERRSRIAIVPPTMEGATVLDAGYNPGNVGDVKLDRDVRELFRLDAGQFDQRWRYVHAHVDRTRPLLIEQERQPPVAAAHVEHPCTLREIG